MKLRPWIIAVATIGFMLALGASFLVYQVWVANNQIEAWEQKKYSPTPGAADLPIEIAGQRFEWRIRYPSSRRLQSDRQLVENFALEADTDREQADDLHLVNELHLWKGAVVQVHLKSRDVLHSFFVPALRLKQDAMPGKVTPVRLAAVESNVAWDAEASDWKCNDQWEFACTEHLGPGPTRMRGQLFVYETKDDFLKWLRRAETIRPQRPGGQ